MTASSAPFADTIVAVSTPPGYSGIGVIRMSGVGVLPMARAMFKPLKAEGDFPDRVAVYGHVVDPGTDTVLDDGIAVLMRGPSSYTGEDVLELSLHGSPIILDMVLRMLVRLGARPATRGEFTRRAFLSGRLDLVQAEAVIDFIEASTPAGAREARGRLDKSLSHEVTSLSDALKDILAELEAHIDFDEDDEGPPPLIEPVLTDILNRMDDLMDRAESGRIRREGVRTVIVGKPNVGKSTLFNALLRADRMIVTPYAGTTRDPVEERLILNGIGFSLWDTAGIRSHPEPVEQEGIARTRLQIENADLIIAVFDATAVLDEEDLAVLDACRDKQIVVALNKIDLGTTLVPTDPRLGPDQRPRFPVSAKTGTGLDDLRTCLEDRGRGMSGDARHQDAAALNRRCLQLMEAAAIPVRSLTGKLSENKAVCPEIVSLELRRTLALLEEITGERVDEGILERIFERFCVGK